MIPSSRVSSNLHSSILPRVISLVRSDNIPNETTSVAMVPDDLYEANQIPVLNRRSGFDPCDIVTSDLKFIIPVASACVYKCMCIRRAQINFYQYRNKPANQQTSKRGKTENNMPINDKSGVSGGVTWVTSTVGNGVSGVTNTVGGVVGAVGRGLGETVNEVTGNAGKPVGDGIKDIGEGIEGGAARVAKGVKNAGEGQHGPLR
ncbi:uncharacterized protein Bfra_001233 [Botrytis fragariae]|uniref:Uncharacterized protein n=1 Tax=Botrytis fragariae TaxID=1964551 RepID=A0A8H6AZX7_9HELO|nr:uncharacterized protein Bfra_001233 [Botrytis fragariae]KAF5876878.1 hypothetical protein Bfra_001233 [Botrytis fragariae]